MLYSSYTNVIIDKVHSRCSKFKFRGSGKVTTLALATLNPSNGSFYLSPYSDWLSEAQVITGAIIISNSDCSLEGNIINMSVSIGTELVQNICKYYCILVCIPFIYCR